MIKDLNENTALRLKSLNEEEKKAKGVLGRLYGPVASFSAPTRNGRKYTQKLWEKLFESDLIKERFANGGIFGQLCHPDYSEVDMEKIACVMPEPPVKDKDGNLVAYVDLIDTPCGRIAYQLAKYGYKFGISSRGEGDLIDGPDGEEVDPETYQLNAFDLVEIPAVENARLSFTESLDKKKYNKTLRESLQESIEKATDADKIIMNEALDNLGIKLEESEDVESKDERLISTLRDSQEIDEAMGLSGALKEISDNAEKKEAFIELVKSKESGNDRGALLDCAREANIERFDRYDSAVKEKFMSYFNKINNVNESLWQELMAAKKDFINTYGEDAYAAYEQYAEEHPEVYNNLYGQKNVEAFLAQYNKNEECNNESCSDNNAEEVVNDKSGELVAELQEALLKIKELEDDNLSLQEKLSVCNAKENELQEQLSKYKHATANLSEKAKQAKSLTEEKTKLEEELSKQTRLSSLNKTRATGLVLARKELNSKLSESKAQIDELNEKLSKLNESLEAKSKQLDSTKETLNRYRKSYNDLKENYLEVKVSSYGLSKDEVKSKLKENYSNKELNTLCEELRAEKKKMSKLPFVINENTNISFKKSKNEYIMNESLNNNSDDYISDSLLHLANLK